MDPPDPPDPRMMFRQMRGYDVFRGPDRDRMNRANREFRDGREMVDRNRENFRNRRRYY